MASALPLTLLTSQPDKEPEQQLGQSADLAPFLSVTQSYGCRKTFEFDGPSAIHETGVNSDPATNTRTLDRALDDAIARLRKLNDERPRELIAKAEVFRRQLAAWEHHRPTHSEQDATIEAIMALLSEAMLLTRGVSTPPPPPSEPPRRAVNDTPVPNDADEQKRHVLGRVIPKKKG